MCCRPDPCVCDCVVPFTKQNCSAKYSPFGKEMPWGSLLANMCLSFVCIFQDGCFAAARHPLLFLMESSRWIEAAKVGCRVQLFCIFCPAGRTGPHTRQQQHGRLLLFTLWIFPYIMFFADGLWQKHLYTSCVSRMFSESIPHCLCKHETRQEFRAG